VLLVDTYDTLAGVRHAITVARELEQRGERLRGVRLDSGDLADLAVRSRQLLDAAGLRDAVIVASGGLDEHKIAALESAGAPIDVFGVGTDLGVSADAPALDIAYKLVEYGGKPRLKLSPQKVTLAGRKQIYRLADAHGAPCADVIALRDEAPPEAGCGPPLLVPVMAGGEPAGAAAPPPPLAELRSKCAERLARLPPDLTRLRGPAAYPVRTSAALEAVQRRIALAHG
jgi:nicotinate phosphoribosyltransferase